VHTCLQISSRAMDVEVTQGTRMPRVPDRPYLAHFVDNSLDLVLVMALHPSLLVCEDGVCVFPCFSSTTLSHTAPVLPTLALATELRLPTTRQRSILIYDFEPRLKRLYDVNFLGPPDRPSPSPGMVGSERFSWKFQGHKLYDLMMNVNRVAKTAHILPEFQH
jgi:hypothetical protein